MTRLLPHILALAPCGTGGLAVAIAATRAGALGFLDLEGIEADCTADTFRLAIGLKVPFGVRVGVESVVADWLSQLPAEVRAVWCLAGSGEAVNWREAASGIVASGRTALFEVTTREAASRAKEAGASGVILAGHEAGGVCGEESSFILLQGVLADGGPYSWVRGGVGPFSAAGCVAAGAAGVVLDGSLLLTRESALDEPTREAISRFDGTGTQVITLKGGRRARVYAPPGPFASARSTEAEFDRDAVGWTPGRLLPIGQDAAFATRLAKRYVTTGGVVRAVEEAINRGIGLARANGPLSPGSPLAEAHGTRHPIVQGPMTRVSDCAAFARAVADGGGLPFLALAMLTGSEVRTLLEDARTRLGERPWGVGVLGFVPPELRREQVRAIREARPPFALIAGGRPDQAKEFEEAGIKTYLHVPSPGLLTQYLEGGARRFVFEGRECGGHVGPRSSLVLWDQAVATLMEFVDRGNPAEDLHVLFAGGIHDSRSSAAVAAIAAPLAARGAKVGVLVGTAYLLTEEAVGTGAIVPRFQAEAIRCRETVLLETGPGHEVRVGPSPFALAFAEARQQLIAAGGSAEEIRTELEAINAGRLRIATKGMDRAKGTASQLIAVDEAAQFERGAYMLGQVVGLRDRVTTIVDLHRDLSEGSNAILQAAHVSEPAKPGQDPKPSDIAIIGLSTIMPGAADVRTFWENTLGKVDSITEVPADRWDWRTYYDPDPKAPDKVVSKWGGFVPDVPFDPLRYGMPPSTVPSIEPVQLLVLEAVRKAFEDAGYAERPFARERTAVVLGMGGGAAQLAMGYAFRSYLPMLESVAPEAGKAAREAAEPLLPEWTEDSFPGFLLNVAAGRVANRFDLGGSNYTVDAACGSSLAAAALAVRELETGAADMVVLGGADTVQNPLTYLAFSKTQAFSPRGRCRPFDASADGIVISEGVGVVILKRLADAERDGDRIYAVIKGMGSSSDGRARGLTAPNVDGQARALRRAYAKAGVDPATLGYVEAHGTGTAVGDVVEMNALAALLREAGTQPGACAVGSVKSMVGHTKCAAGMAGLINASLALHHKVLPPTIGVQAINPKADLVDGPLRVSTEARPWFHDEASHPRRAGVSAFGFGGTNFHAVLEAYERDPLGRPPAANEWPAELLLWRAETPAALGMSLESLDRSLSAGAAPRLRDLARSLAERFDSDAVTRPTLAIVATSLDDLRAKLTVAREAIAVGRATLSGRNGVEYAERPAFPGAKVSFLFPGQGSQSLEMQGDLAMAFSEVREAFEAFDAALSAEGQVEVTPRIFPPTTLDHAGRELARQALTATEVAQPAIGAASVGMLRLLGSLGIEAAILGGHSFGELVALHAAGSLSISNLAALAAARGRLMRDSAAMSPGAMSAILADPERTRRAIGPDSRVVIANLNGPKQTVVSGPRDDVARVAERARTQGLRVIDLPVACAFHSEAVAAASSPLAEAARMRISAAPDRPVFSNLDAGPHPSDPAAIATRLGSHLASTVRFAEMVEAMHEAGARIFLEVGPGSALGNMTAAILGDRPHLAVSTDAPGRPGIPTLLRSLAQLAAAGVAFRPVRLTSGRDARRINLESLPVGDGSPAPSASTWLVNGSRSRPIAAPEPKRLGQAIETVPSDASRDGRPNGLVANGPSPPQRLSSMKTSPRTDTPAPSANGRDERYVLNIPPLGGANGHNGHAPPPQPAPSSNGHALPTPEAGSARVMEAFQQTMRAFLEAQQATMLAYLGQRPARPASVPSAQGTITSPPAAYFGSENGNGHANHYSNGNGHHASANSLTMPPIESTVVETPTHPPEPPKPVPAPAPAAQAPSQPEPVTASRDAIATRLVEIVRDRTGYPAEMLKLDLDMEADLGIDSIKRVEILGTLRESVAGLETADDATLMDSLSRAKTLGQVIDKVAATLESRKPSPPIRVVGADKSQAAETAGVSISAVRRLTLAAVDAPLAGAADGLATGGVVVMTDDGRGVARSLETALRAEGRAVEILPPDKVDFTSPSSVSAALDEVRSSGPIAGIIHALPLRPSKPAGLDAAEWNRRMGTEVKGLFNLARSAADDLERASRQGGSCLIAATAMGGSFSVAGAASDDFFPGQGGVAGLMKTLAREWPEVRARVVDLDPTEPPDRLARRLAAEALSDDGWPEVGYHAGRRIRLRTVPDALDRTTPEFAMSPGEPLLITGGARGITAAIAGELARRWRPTLLLVGSSPQPSNEESSATAGLTAGAELKTVLHGVLRQAGRGISPADLERAYRTLLNEREIRETLRAIRDAGSTVEYAQADVRDAEAMSRTLGRWRERFGEPAGLIHGAGVIHDKLLRDKSPESFDRVLGTKLDGALNLARLVRPEALRFAAFFSSIAGRFGNMGQSDYAAANEALNKLAVWLDRRWSGRVVSINWGPWSGLGMVSDLEGHLGRRGLGMIPPSVGCSAMVDELAHGLKGDVEVVVAGALGSLDEPLCPARTRAGVAR